MQVVEANNVPVIRALIELLVPGYQLEDEVVDWVWMEQGRAA